MTLKINHVTFERNNQLLFKDVQFELNAGECLQLRGANGTGKSTLLRIIAGLLEPTQGDVQWQNQSIFKHKNNYKKKLHYIGHQNGIRPYLTVYENLHLNRALFDISQTSDQIYAAIQSVGLSHVCQSAAHHLSAGQTRRLSLAKLKLNCAPLWILDEPTTALDEAGQSFLMDFLNEHLANKGMAIVATHQNLQLANEPKTLHLHNTFLTAN